MTFYNVLSIVLEVNAKKKMYCLEGDNKQDMVPDHGLEATNMEQNSDNNVLCYPSTFINYYRVE